MRFWIFIATACVVALTGIIVGITTATYYVQKNACYSFGRQTDREVRWVMYHLASWDCITPAKDGKWIPTKRLRDLD